MPGRGGGRVALIRPRKRWGLVGVAGQGRPLNGWCPAEGIALGGGQGKPPLSLLEHGKWSGCPDPERLDLRAVASTGERGQGRGLDWVLALLMAFVFSGAERYLVTYSNALHYGFDGVLLVVAILSLSRHHKWLGLGRAAGPYALFLIVYVGWGSVVADQPYVALGRGLDMLVLNALIFLGVAAAIRDQRSLERFALVVQVAVLVNVAISLMS